jgi:division protein CdvB (Snf7/Vps24/ESCRT-III family)
MMETVSTIKDTSTQFKIISKHVNISKLEDSIEEMFEQNEACSSIEDALSDLNNSVLVDDDDLKEELEKMMSDVGDRDQQPGLPVHFPTAPVFNPKVTKTNATKSVVPA